MKTTIGFPKKNYFNTFLFAIVWFQKISIPPQGLFCYFEAPPPPLLWKFQFSLILPFKNVGL